MPIVLTAKASRDLQPGGELQVLADDRAFPKDVKAWCTKTGHELLNVEYAEGHYKATIRRN